jgi:prevent-host-death family protein
LWHSHDNAGRARGGTPRGNEVGDHGTATIDQEGQAILMSDMVDISEAQSNLASLVARVEAGEEVLIAREGRPVARLASAQGGISPRRPGLWRGRVQLSPDFDAVDEDLLRAFGA